MRPGRCLVTTTHLTVRKADPTSCSRHVRIRIVPTAPVQSSVALARIFLPLCVGITACPAPSPSGPRAPRERGRAAPRAGGAPPPPPPPAPAPPARTPPAPRGPSLEG